MKLFEKIFKQEYKAKKEKPKMITKLEYIREANKVIDEEQHEAVKYSKKIISLIMDENSSREDIAEAFTNFTVRVLLMTRMSYQYNRTIALWCSGYTYLLNECKESEKGDDQQ